MVRGGEQFKQAARLPIEIGKLSVRIARWGGDRVVSRAPLGLLAMGREFAPGGGHIAKRLEATRPLSDARLGAEDVVRGLQEDDPGLMHLGGRNYIESIVSADRDPKVPDKVTSEVVDMRHGLPVDPLESPLVRPELADEARGVISRFELPIQARGDESLEPGK